jgi:hypothetical protein
MIRVHNTQTNEVIDRQMNEDEFAIYAADQAAEAVKQAEAEAKAAQKAALLERLGITQEEANLLLG